MENIFLLLFLLSPVLLLAGLVKPSLFSKRIPQLPNRKRISGFFVLLFILSFIGFAITMPEIESDQTSVEKNTQSTPEDTQPDQQVVSASDEQEPTIIPTTADANIKPSETPAAQSSPDPQVQGTQLVKVTRVIDGDTIEIQGGERVRLIGIDAPESGDCYSGQSDARLRELIGGAEIRLEKDVSETDRYGRLLRYIFLGDRNINAEMVSGGYANASTYPPDVKYSNEFASLQSEARNKDLGLWGDVCANIQPTATTVPAQPTNPPNSGSACSPYACGGPDVDCGDFGSHSQAQAWFDCCGFSVNNDPHRLDAIGIGDGIACENI